MTACCELKRYWLLGDLGVTVGAPLSAAGKATSFHDLPGKQQAACKAMRQHLTQDDNTQPSSCASDGSPGFTAHKKETIGFK